MDKRVIDPEDSLIYAYKPGTNEQIHAELHQGEIAEGLCDRRPVRSEYWYGAWGWFHAGVISDKIREDTWTK